MDALFTLAGLVMLVGLLIHLFCPPDKPSDKGPVWIRARVIEIGRLMFACGLLALLWAIGKRVVVG